MVKMDASVTAASARWFSSIEERTPAMLLAAVVIVRRGHQLNLARQETRQAKVEQLVVENVIFHLIELNHL
jgi:hypothetical protein